MWNPEYRALAPFASAEDPYVGTLSYLFRTLLYLGYLDRARLQLHQAITEARRCSPYALAWALRHAWYGTWDIEGMESAPSMLCLAEEVLVISREQGYAQWTAAGNIMRGWWCLGAMGQTAEAIPLILDGLTIYSATGAKVAIPFFLTTFAEVYGLAGRPDLGLSKATKLVETTQQRWAEAEMHRLRGTLLLTMDEYTAAEDSYCQALTG